MHIRDAVPADITRVMELCQEALDNAFYRHLPLDPQSTRRVMMYCIGSPAQFCQVVEVDGQIEGLLAGTCERVWHSNKKQASDLVFYTTPAGRGSGSLLVRRFIRWARSRPGIGLIGVSVSYGGSNIKRTGKMLEKLGLTYVGGIYMENINEQPSQENRKRSQERGQGRGQGVQEDWQGSGSVLQIRSG
jgi:hypothetical protein